MKFYYILPLLNVLNFVFCYSQKWDGNDIIDDPKYYSPPSNSVLALKNSAQEKTLSINVHFILRDDGTGNFAKDWDGVDYSNNYNGYYYADEIIDWCNYWLERNVELRHHQAGVQLPVLPINYKYQLSGVFFHNSSFHYNTQNLGYVASSFNNNPGEALNLYFTCWGNGGGVAYLNGAYAEIHGYYPAYINYRLPGTDDPTGWNYSKGFADAINHEIGHNLSLEHTKTTPSTDCCDGINFPYCDDDCDDTPTYQEVLAQGFPDPCFWGGPLSSNNLIDNVNENRGLSPCQIDQVHSHIEGYKTTYYPCFYTISQLILTSPINDNISYFARSIIIPSGSNLNVSNYNGLFLNAEEIEINGEFTVELGSELIVNITPHCN